MTTQHLDTDTGFQVYRTSLITSVAISATARWQYHFCGYYCHRRWQYHFCGFLLTPVFRWQYHRPLYNAQGIVLQVPP